MLLRVLGGELGVLVVKLYAPGVCLGELDLDTLAVLIRELCSLLEDLGILSKALAVHLQLLDLALILVVLRVGLPDSFLKGCDLSLQALVLVYELCVGAHTLLKVESVLIEGSAVGLGLS